MTQPMVTRYDIAHSMLHDLRTGLDAAVKRVKVYRAYRQTMRELSDLSGHELADLGLHRSEIRRVARDSVYSAWR